MQAPGVAGTQAPTAGGTGTTVVGGAGAAGAGGSAGASAPSGTELWVSPTGDDAAQGTQAAPFKTLTKAVAAIRPGMTIRVLPGTYASTETVKLAADGSMDQPLRIFAAEGGERPVFDFSAQPRGQSSARGFEISGTYWHIKGLELMKAGDNCIHIAGSHNTVENVITHGCDDTGLQITANSSDAANKQRAAYNTILNCDSYENFDSQNQGENADGFAAKLYIGIGNVFRGCRAWNNSDDGWDLFASDDVVTIENCWAIANGKIGPAQNNTNGDGNGFKLGGAAKDGDANMGGAEHVVKNCASIGNRACGFVRNNNTQVPQLSMCGGQGDGKGTFCSLSTGSNLSVSSSAQAAIAAKRNPDGSLPALP